MPHADKIRILIAHEDAVVAAGLHAILGAEAGLSVALATAGTSGSAGSALDGGPADRVDVIVADYQGGLAMLAQLKESAGGGHVPRVLVVTQLAREWEVRVAMNAGVFGYVLQSCEVHEIVSGVRMAGAGRRYLCEAVAERIAESLTRVTLTTREAEVLELLQRGLCNKTIARDLGIAPGTVKAHVKGILEKLEATTRTHAVAVAAHRGLIRTSVAPSSASAGHPRRDRLPAGAHAGVAHQAAFA